MIVQEHSAANYVLVVILMAFVLRLAVPLIALATTKDKTIFYTSDTMGYLEPAMNIIATGHYSRDNLPEIFRPPGYPIFLIPSLLLGNPEIITIAFQIIVSCLTVFLVYKIALRLFERTDVAVLSAALYALEPLSIVYTSLMMTETLFASVVMLAIYFLVDYLKEAKLKSFCMAGLVLSAAVYIRPVAYFVPLIAVIATLATSAVRKELNKKLLIHICVFLFIAMAPIFAWQARNRIEAGYSGFCAATDEAIFQHGQSLLAKIQGISVTEQMKRSGWSYWNSPSAYYSQHPEHISLDPATILRHRRNEGLRLILDNPWQFLQSHARGTFLMAGLTGLGTWLVLFKVDNPDSAFRIKLRDPSSLRFISDFFSSDGTVFWGNLFLGLVLLIYWLLAVYAFTFRKVRGKAGVILMVLIGVYFLVAPGDWAESRYRHPVMPIVCIMAGYGLHTIIARIRGSGSLLPSEIIQGKPVS